VHASRHTAEIDRRAGDEPAVGAMDESERPHQISDLIIAKDDDIRSDTLSCRLQLQRLNDPP
jgi:hypothetical protein